MARKPVRPPEITRRTALRGLAAAAGSVLAAACRPSERPTTTGGLGTGDTGPEPDSDTGAPVPPPDTASPDTDPVAWDGVLPIDTFVVLMMENRSFDHFFGAMTLEEGRQDIDGLTSAMSNPTSAGVAITPYPSTDLCPDDPPHHWDACHEAYAEGDCSGFVQENEQENGEDSGPAVMGYHNRTQLPVHYALADFGTLCQYWFCSVMGPTWPNRLYALSGQSEGVKANEFPDWALGFSQATIFDRLDAAGISWAYYFTDVPFLALFPAFIGREELRPLSRFYEDALEGKLPKVVWIDPGFGFNDDHPSANIKLGQMLISSVFAAVSSSPQWSRSCFLLTYDEHGGFFDHVAPPTAQDERAADGFDQLGFRVPTVVAGPWVKQGHVSSVQYDHTSWLRQVCTMLGLDPLTTRDATANDLSDVFDIPRIVAGDPAPPPPIPVIDYDLDELGCTDEAVTSQPELVAVFERGLVDPKLDRRPLRTETLDTIARHAERLGVARLRR